MVNITHVIVGHFKYEQLVENTGVRHNIPPLTKVAGTGIRGALAAVAEVKPYPAFIYDCGTQL